MMAEFVLMVALGNSKCCIAEHYVGTFNSCTEAHEYVKNHMPEGPKETRCLLKQYTNLPKDFRHKYIIDACKIKRDCDGKYSKAYREANREKIIAQYGRAYYEANKEQTKSIPRS
jgi:hypothetical protein